MGMAVLGRGVLGAPLGCPLEAVGASVLGLADGDNVEGVLLGLDMFGPLVGATVGARVSAAVGEPVVRLPLGCDVGALHGLAVGWIFGQLQLI